MATTALSATEAASDGGALELVLPLAAVAAFFLLVPLVLALERRGTTAARILLVAAALRLLALPLPPVLSDDVLRYLWDGRVTAAGENPYRLAPDDPRLAPLRAGAPGRDGDDLWQRLPHRHVATVYPPLALGLFSIAAAAGPERAAVLAWKALVAAADLAACAFLIALAAACGLPRARAAWYAWNPLVVLEGAGMGHLDAIAVAALVAAAVGVAGWRRRSGPRADDAEDAATSGDSVCSGDAEAGAPAQVPTSLALLGTARGAGVRDRVHRRGSPPGAGRPTAAALAAVAGVAAKLGPILALPLLARRSRRPLVFGGVAAAATAAVLAPVALSTGGVPPGLATYGVSWEFNGPLYEPLWRLLAVAGAAPAAKGLLALAESAVGAPKLLDPVYPYVYPQLLAKLALAPLLLVAVARSFADRSPLPAALGRLFGTALLAAATLYPWYLLWVLPWAALERQPAWLLAGGLAPLVYLPQATGVALFPWVFLLAWGPPAAGALLSSRWRGWRRDVRPESAGERAWSTA